MSRVVGATYGSHPLVRYVRSLEGEYFLAREVADMLEISDTKLIALRKRSPTPLGATHRAQYGSVVIHLYTPQRIAEIAEYMKAENEAHPGNRSTAGAALWTRTEQTRRERDRRRVRNYRNRAVTYREKGMEKEAARMDKMAATLTAQLEKAQIKRWTRVHGRPYEPKK